MKSKEYYQPFLDKWRKALEGSMLGKTYTGFAVALLLADIRESCAETPEEEQFFRDLSHTLLGKKETE